MVTEEFDRTYDIHQSEDLIEKYHIEMKNLNDLDKLFGKYKLNQVQFSTDATFQWSTMVKHRLNSSKSSSWRQ